MDWRDIAAIVFVCTAVNHLGLIAAIQAVTRCRELPIISCPKCFTFWSVMVYGIATVPFGCPAVLPPFLTAVYSTSAQGLIAFLLHLLAISLLCSYVAIWLELIMYAIDTLYNKIYGILEDNSKEDSDKD